MKSIQPHSRKRLRKTYSPVQDFHEEKKNKRSLANKVCIQHDMKRFAACGPLLFDLPFRAQRLFMNIKEEQETVSIERPRYISKE